MTEGESEVIRGLHRELGLCERQRDGYRALLEQVLRAYDDKSYGEGLFRAMSAVRSVLETTS
jgi:hypothetical protein